MLPKQMNNPAAGLRKSTFNSCAAQQLSRRYQTRSAGEDDGCAITRTQALQVAKRAAAALGLKSTKIALIDQLFAHTKACDWTTEGIVPVIWPSNLLLARRMGIAVSTIRYHLRGLTEAGLIAYSDHPTYQRSGRRDASGQIVEAYGINLSPIAMRFHELNELAERAEYDAIIWRTLSQQRTVLRKEITALLISLSHQDSSVDYNDIQGLQARLDRLRETTPANSKHVEEIIEQFKELRIDAELLFEGPSWCQELSTAVSGFEQHTTTALPTNPVNCKQIRHRVKAQSALPINGFAEKAYEKKPDADIAPRQVSISLNAQKSSSGRVDGVEVVPTSPNKCPDQTLSNQTPDPLDDLPNISLPLIKAACPSTIALVPEVFASWTSLRNSGGHLCRIASINPQVFSEATDRLGPDLAITALAITIERSANGVVLNPGAYLRALSQRGKSGTLHLSRSLFALAANR